MNSIRMIAIGFAAAVALLSGCDATLQTRNGQFGVHAAPPIVRQPVYVQPAGVAYMQVQPQLQQLLYPQQPVVVIQRNPAFSQPVMNNVPCATVIVPGTPYRRCM